MLDSTSRITIVIPTLQEAKALPQTLEQFSAAIRQQHNLEIVISDGGSTDGTVPIARSLADLVVEHDDDVRQNISQGRNRGAEAASGDILVFLNADVLIEEIEKFFSTIHRVMRDDHVVAATCNVNIYPEEERLSDWLFHNFFNGYFWLLNLFGMGMGRGECHIIRKDLFNELHGYDEKLAAGEDYELFLRLHCHGKIVFIRTLTVFESPRRFRKYGYFWISILWFLNALSVLIFRRSMVDEWKPIR
jgi:glycosyltransferase involved in cell wall biosynthesis